MTIALVHVFRGFDFNPELIWVICWHRQGQCLARHFLPGRYIDVTRIPHVPERALLKMLLDGPKALDNLPRDYGKADVGPLEALATVDDITARSKPLLARDFLALLSGLRKADGDRLLSALDLAALSAGAGL